MLFVSSRRSAGAGGRAVAPGRVFRPIPRRWGPARALHGGAALSVVSAVARALFALSALAAPSRAFAQPAPAPQAPSQLQAPPQAQGAPPTDAAPSAATPDAAQPAAGEASPADPPPPAASSPTVLVLETAIYGIDPIVGRYVTSTIRQTAGEMGYALVDDAAARQAAASVRMPYPPAPADLWRATWAARAARGVFARAWAHAGQYVVELTVASADGGGPFFARGSAGAQDLVAVVATLLRQALPAPGVSTAPPGGVPGLQAGGAGAGADGVGAGLDDDAAAPRRRRRAGRARRWVVSGRFDSAFGLSGDSFYNALLGVRLDYRITPDLRLGAMLSYANLRGKDGRANNVLPLVHMEYRARIARGSEIRIPLRVGLGYLPYNGPVVRLSAGLGFVVARRWELDFDLLAPTFWVIPNKTVVSLDLAAQVGYRF